MLVVSVKLMTSLLIGGCNWGWGRIGFLVKRATEMTPKLVQTPLNVIIIYD